VPPKLKGPSIFHLDIFQPSISSQAFSSQDFLARCFRRCFGFRAALWRTFPRKRISL
jgi:hypothetical protein